MKKLKRIPNLPEPDDVPTIEDVQKDLGLDLMTFMSQMAQAPDEQVDPHDLSGGKQTPPPQTTR